MRVFVKNSADPFTWREGEHVVAVTVRPIGHGHAGAVGSHEAAHENEQQRRGGGELRGAVEKKIVTDVLHEKRAALWAAAKQISVSPRACPRLRCIWFAANNLLQPAARRIRRGRDRRREFCGNFRAAGDFRFPIPASSLPRDFLALWRPKSMTR